MNLFSFPVQPKVVRQSSVPGKLELSGLTTSSTSTSGSTSKSTSSKTSPCANKLGLIAEGKKHLTPSTPDTYAIQVNQKSVLYII